MPERPNILVFMADHLMADVLKPDNPCLMPNAERLMAEGVTFSRTFCTAPHCCPSRASFYTGEVPSVHGVWNNVDNPSAIHLDLNPDVETFSEALKKEGYNLAHAGKFHISHTRTPKDFGFEEYLVKEIADSPVEDVIERYHNAEDTELEGEGLIRRPGWRNRRYYGTNEGHIDPSIPSSETVCRRGIDAINDVSARGEPWCVFASVNPPHDPYHPPKQFLDLYEGVDIDLPESWPDTMEDKPRIYQRMRRQYWSQLGEEESRKALKAYYALCTMVDSFLGRLLEALETTGQAENTLVLFTSDHGDYAGAHGLWAKGIPAFREAYHIPAVMRWPREMKNPGRAVDELVSITDFMPTFIEAATGRTPDVFGRSLLPFLRDEKPAWRDYLVGQCNGVELYYTQRSIFTKDWKYVYNGFDFDEMYDLRHDPHETTNLANPDLYDQGHPWRDGEFVPWPRMTEELEAARRDLLEKLWRFARAEKDGRIYTGYQTVAMAPYGPGII